MRIINYPLMPVPEYRNPTQIPVTAIRREHELDKVLREIRTADAVAVDTETHSAVIVDGIWAALRVIAVATRHGNGPDATYQAFVIDVRDLSPDRVASVMSAVTKAYAWNASFDDRVMRLYGAPVKRWHDVMLDESVLWSGIDGRGWYLSLAVAVKRYIGYDMVGKGTTQTSFDGTSDLSDEQIDYAGHDAVLTLWVGEVIDRKISQSGLVRASELEQGARPFIAMMIERGFPFRQAAWKEYLGKHVKAKAEARSKICDLTGGGVEVDVQGADGSVTGTETVPKFNVDSDVQLREQFNLHARDFVVQRFGRAFEPADQVDKATMMELKAVGCDLAAAILEYRNASKFLSTYGDNIDKFVRDDGRIHARYKQCLTATGRLASDSPNAQNWPGSAKAYISPLDGRLLVSADYSQAELRVLAYLAEEPRMIEAFASGADLHELTANEMFHIDIAELKKTDPKGAKEARTKTKRVNFGIPYGLGAAALARQLTNEGVETSTEEAQALLDGYNAINPNVANWLKVRDEFVRSIANDPGPVDWKLSFRLLELFQEFEPLRRKFKKANKRLPSSEELSDLAMPEQEQLDLFAAVLTTEEREETRKALAAELDWAFTYDAPVVLRPGGEPLAWESRTVSGRRRLFTVAMDSGYRRSENDSGSSASASDKFDGLVTSAMLIAATTDKPAAAAVRDSWAATHKVPLPKGVDRCPRQPGENNQAYRARARRNGSEERTRCVKAFEGQRKLLKTAFVRHVCESMGQEVTDFLLGKALSDQIRKLGNAFRNHPIQGTVADIAEAAFAELYALCDDFPDLWWIQSVHDSIIGECDEGHAVVVGRRQKEAMESAMVEFCPAVPAKVDAEVCTSLDEADIIIKIEAEPSEQELAMVAAAA